VERQKNNKSGKMNGWERKEGGSWEEYKAGNEVVKR
jgi:hypothetical protein